MPNPSTIEAESDLASSAWEVDDDPKPQPVACWQRLRRTGPECAVVGILAGKVDRLQAEAQRLREAVGRLEAADAELQLLRAEAEYLRLLTDDQRKRLESARECYESLRRERREASSLDVIAAAERAAK